MPKCFAVFLTAGRHPILFSLALASFAAVAESRPKVILGSGWDLLDATTEDVWRNRAKFAETGLDGILMSLDRTGADGKRSDGRGILDRVEWQDSDFDRSRKLVAECVACPGLRESMALAFLIPHKRLDWKDDEGWRIAANNVSRLARAAKSCGLKGLVFDHEDYFKQRQFRLNPQDGDFDAVCALARWRGREFFGALFREYSDVRLLFYWMFTEWRDVVRSQDPLSVIRTYKGGDVWPAFLNGLLDVVPPGVRLVDGNESNGYRTDVRKANFQTGAWESLRAVLPLVAPENRAKYLNQVSVGFGIYIDSYVCDESICWAFPPLGGSRAAACRQNVLAAAAVADDCLWVYGEAGAWVDWDDKRSAKMRGKTWNSQLPGVAQTMRLAADRVGAMRDLVAAGQLTNLVADVESKDGKLPPWVTTWTKESRPSDKDIFQYDAAEGAARAGCLKLVGDGTFTVSANGLTPGEAVYVRLKAKGRAPSVNVAWKRNGSWDWNLGSNLLAPEGKDPAAWRTVEGVFVVPDTINGLGVTLSGQASEENAIRFDDIEIWR